MAKTNLTADDLKHFRKDLLDRREQLVGTMNELEEEIKEEKGRQPAGAANTDVPTHMADAAGDVRSERMTRSLSDRELETVREIDEALERMRNGTYGLCVVDQRPIGRQRLEAKPWAKFCLEHAE